MSVNDSSKINLAALRKVDSTISSIVDSGNQVALYKYIIEKRKWDKTDIEGTFFVYMRSQKPQHGFMVMNRRSTTNLVEPITDQLDFQEQAPFLLYRNDKGQIYGLWFYETKNCEKMCKLLSSLSQLAVSKPDKSSSMRQRSYSETNKNVQKQEADIISLLSKAQDEYDKSQKSAAKNILSTQHSSNGNVVKPTPIHVNNNGVTTPAKDLVTPLTLGMLFAQATQKSQEEPSNIRGQSKTLGESGDSILQNLLSNSAHTLQHIEATHKKEESTLSIETMEKDLKEKLNILPKPEILNKSDPIDIPIFTPAMLESQQSVPYGSPFNASLPVMESRSFSPTQLLSPMDFTLPLRKPLMSSSYSPEPNNGAAKGSHEDLLAPQSLLNKQVKASKVTPLNKDQFKEALLYMLQNDDGFVIQLHECYVKSLKSQLTSLHTS